jgi:hypothetical protein
MSQETSNSTKVLLNGPDLWEDWEQQFQSQAIAYDLWDHIDRNEPLIKKPIMPDRDSYQRQVQTRASTGRTTGSSQTQAGTSRSQTAEPEPTIGDLTKQAREAFQYDMQFYIQCQKEYKEQVTSIQKLKKWVTDSVASHYFRVACKPTEDLRHWYTNLRTHVGISKAKAERTARDRYKEAVKPLAKPKDWSNWLNNWEKAMVLAVEKKVPEALSTSAWTSDFFVAITPIAENWVTSYQITQQDKIDEGLLTFRKVAHDFREKMGNIRISQGYGPRVAKGAFGPTYAGQDTPDQGTTEDAQKSSTEGALSDRRRRGKGSLGKRKAPEEEEESSGRFCVACDLNHPLFKCYYAFPEKAPQWFKENPEVRAAVDNLLKTDSTLREKIQKLKGKRPKTSPKESQSAKESQPTDE